MSVHPNKLLIATGQGAGVDRAHVRWAENLDENNNQTRFPNNALSFTIESYTIGHNNYFMGTIIWTDYLD